MPAGAGTLRPEPGSRRCGAPGGTRCTTVWSSGSESAPGAAASTSSPRPVAPTRHRASSSLASTRPARPRGPPALRQGRKQVVQHRSRLVVGDSRSDDHGPRRSAARRRRSAAKSPPAVGAAARRASASRAGDVGGGVRYRRNRGRRRPGEPHRVRLRQGVDRRRVAGDPDATLQPRRLRQCRRSTPPASATARTASITAPRTSPATQLHAGSDLLRRQQPAGPPRNLAVAGGEAWRRSNDFDLSWVNPDQASGEPDRRRLLADRPAQLATTAAPSSSPAMT